MGNTKLKAVAGELFDQLQAQATRNRALINLLTDKKIIDGETLSGYLRDAEQASAKMWLDLRKKLFGQI